MGTLGILLPIFSLPEGNGIGDFKAGINFLKFLKKNNYNHWQILPVGPVDPAYHYSPYTSFSSFALNSLFISTGKTTTTNKVHYAKVWKNKKNALEKMFFKFKPTPAYHKFCKKAWLQDYALFMACSEYFKAPWYEWPTGLAKREKQSIQDWSEKLKKQIAFHKFVQYTAYQEWQTLHNTAKKLKIKIIGDLPIFVAHNSADVWANQAEFQLDEGGLMTNSAGVPPDYFNPNGQTWNLPLYNWHKMQENNFNWWLKRIGAALELFDLVRLDHFRGFEACFAIPTQGKANDGHWQKSPGQELFTAIQAKFPKMPFIAEDLGIITREVDTLRNNFGLPGMKVGIIPFLDYETVREEQGRLYFPEHYPENSVAYSTTHDFNTLLGWYQTEATPAQQEFLLKKIGAKTIKEMPAKFKAYLTNSKSKLIISPWQDIAGLGAQSRINFPGTTGQHNWTWRVKKVLENFKEKS